VYFYPYVNDEKYERLNTLNNVFSRCDIISLHIHASKDNNQLINDNVLRLRRDNLILVNTSRGEIVDEDDILKFLNSDRNFVYATDVITDENKLVKDNKLLKANEKLSNLIITPYIGGMSYGVQKLAYHKAVDLLESYAEEL
jgi:D-3-phosphoglycerate dehydrogenase / 2-oxoglutarate reductase